MGRDAACLQGSWPVSGDSSHSAVSGWSRSFSWSCLQSSRQATKRISWLDIHVGFYLCLKILGY